MPSPKRSLWQWQRWLLKHHLQLGKIYRVEREAEPSLSFYFVIDGWSAHRESFKIRALSVSCQEVTEIDLYPEVIKKYYLPYCKEAIEKEKIIAALRGLYENSDY